MDKLNLDLDDLEVDSFHTNPEQEDEQGTVQGNGDTCDNLCTLDYPCPTLVEPTCDLTCDDWTCRFSCPPCRIPGEE